MMLFDCLSSTTSSTCPILSPELLVTLVPMTFFARMALVWPVAVVMHLTPCAKRETRVVRNIHDVELTMRGHTAGSLQAHAAPVSEVKSVTCGHFATTAMPTTALAHQVSAAGCSADHVRHSELRAAMSAGPRKIPIRPKDSMPPRIP